MSTGYRQFHDEPDEDEEKHPTEQPGSEAVYAPPSPYYPPGSTVPMVQAVAPQSQTILSTSTVCQPNDYFGLALFVTICCCLPLGIVGLIKANDVRSRFQVGDMAGAEQASKEAKMYSLVGLGIGIGLLVLVIVATVVLVVLLVNDAGNALNP